MKKQIIVLLLVSVFLLSSVQSAMAQFEMPNTEDLMRTILQFIFGEYPEGWLNTNSFLQIVIFPFIALFAVFYGLLTELKIFKGQGTTKLVIALMFSFGGGWFALSSMKGFMVLNATLATWGFGIVLFLGIIFWAGAGISRGYTQVSGQVGPKILKGMRDREDKEKKRERLQKQADRAYSTWERYARTNPSVAERAYGEYVTLNQQVEDLEKQIEEGRKAGT